MNEPIKGVVTTDRWVLLGHQNDELWIDGERALFCLQFNAEEKWADFYKWVDDKFVVEDGEVVVERRTFKTLEIKAHDCA